MNGPAPMSIKPDDPFTEILSVLYDSVSAAPDQRDWEIERPLFHPSARLVRTGLDEAGKPFVLSMSFDEYVENAATLLEGVRFTEREIERAIDVFGNVARIASAYEFSWESSSEERRGRGVNFLTLAYNGEAWQIISIVWDNERPGLSLESTGLLKKR